jgi:glucose/arabinose dehydrogenase/PKD repeat protein
MLRALATGALALTALLPAPASSSLAATLPAGFSDTLVTTVPQPTALAFLPDGRMLVTSRDGQLWLGAPGATPALDLSARICPQSERGLLGVAVDPDFQANRHIYLYYTFDKYDICNNSAPPNGPVNRVSRFTLGTDNRVSLGSELVLIDGIPSPAGTHNGGHVIFGKDNYLYVSVGDGGCDYAGDSGCAGSNDAARDRNVLLGKVLRITTAGGIPADNPFQGAGSARCNLTARSAAGTTCQETFAWGLRNPFRLGFDPNAAATRFFINDVGQGAWEEIDEGRPGADYGWNMREGHCLTYSTTDCPAPPAGVTNPIYDYGRETGCGAITAGAFVPNGLWPAEYNGRYLFGDYSCGKVRSLRLTALGWAAADFGSDLGAVVDMRFGPWGSSQALYYINWEGQVRRIAYTGNREPAAVARTSATEGDPPLGVLFDASASRDPDGGTLTYDWDFGDGTAHSAAAKPGHVYNTAGTYKATLRVTDDRGASTTDSVRIDVGNSSPVPTIQSPTPSTRFRVGQPITLRGSASDPQDGPLTAFSMSWTVVLHHGSHTHPFLGPKPGNDIAFTAPPPEDLAAAATSWLEVRLTATDSKGRTRTVSQELRPHTVGLIFKTVPEGLRLIVDGTPVRGPAGFVSWEGYRFTVDAPNLQAEPGKVWGFTSWSDGGAAKHEITTGSAPGEYAATWSSAQCGGGVGVGVLLVLVVGALRRRRVVR